MRNTIIALVIAGLVVAVAVLVACEARAHEKQERGALDSRRRIHSLEIKAPPVGRGGQGTGGAEKTTLG